MVLGVLFGSRSCEHDVSIVTAVQAMQNIDQKKYNIVPVYIDRDGKWYTGDGLANMANYQVSMKEAYGVTPCIPAPYGGNKLALYKWPLRGFIFKMKPLAVIDVVLPAFHGVNGEDGSVQGMLELYNVPYACPGITGSAVGMDKTVMKACFKGCGFPMLPYVWFTRDHYEKAPNEIIMKIEEELTYPVFVKPANLGSSIGISKANDREGLLNAIDIAKAYDRKILVENGLTELDEINCAAVGFGENVTVSLCEQPVSWEDFLTFDDKYMRSNSGKGMESLQRKIPAPISDQMTKTIQDMTRDVFNCLDLKGVCRIDYMIDKVTGNLYINEINTIPGSLSFYLFEPLGIYYSKLIDMMIDSAIKAHEEKQKNDFSFDSQILKKVGSGLSGAKGGKLGGKMGGSKIGKM